MKIETLENLFAEEMRDLYSAENQMIKALPKIAKSVDSDELRSAFEEHLEQTHTHVERIEEICQRMNISPKGRKCLGMEGLIKEGDEMLGNSNDPAPLDAAAIGIAQRFEHYEIAAYGAARAHARQMGFVNAAELLSQTLVEEKQANRRLTDLALNQVNVLAAMST
jgi:ferritin-like metal-binding protein YciE